MAFEVVELEILKHPLVLRRLREVRATIHHRLGPLTGTVATSPEPVPFSERFTLATKPVRRGTFWGTAPGCAWFHLTAELPLPAVGRAWAGEPGLVAPGVNPGADPAYELALIVDLDGEGLVLDRDGSPVAAITSRLTPIERHGAARGKTRIDLLPGVRERLAPEGSVELWVDAGFNGKLVPPLGLARVRELAVVRVDRAAEAYYYDLLTASYAALATRDRASLDALTDSHAAWKAGDLTTARTSLRPALGRGDAEVEAPGHTGDLRVTAIGHGHLDMAWLWPVRETRRKARRTLQGQLDLLERYPEHTYGISQPQQLAWVERDDPALFERLRGAVTAGRIELQGGFWVEPDTNLPSGESLVRQAIHGQRYWQSRFGQRARMCWLPDAFGYSAALPQILRGAGMTSFSTIKLAWNEHNDFPHRSFVWTGLDGSDVVVHMPPEGSYNSSATALALAALVAQYPEADLAGEALLVYGSGDGGGGPGPAHLEVLARSAHLPSLPPVTSGTVEAFFDRLTERAADLPHFSGELYLEKHQGTLTTQAATKKWNRRIEHRLHDLEWLAALAWWHADRPWPQVLLDQAWADVLLFQFHDMLPGSSIARVHRECETRYAELDGLLLEEQAALLAGGAESPETVVSTSPTRRRGFTRRDGGWFRYDLGAYGSAALEPWDGERTELAATPSGLSNDRLQVTFGPDGAITSLRDRSSGREHAGAYLNRLVLHKDRWSYFDAWDIDEGWLSRSGEVLVPQSVQTLIDGPRAIHRHIYVHGKTRIEQDIVLTPGQDYLLFETRVDWHERHRMLRAHFAPAARADEISCEIQFGHLRRSTREDTATQRAQTEICSHRWIDITTDDGDPFGLSLVNDSKYGHRAKGGELSLNLLRAPIYPDPRADRGRHTFAYALHPHEGALVEGETLAVATELNAPLLLTRAGSPAVRQPAPMVHPAQVVLDTVTRSSDGRALVLRLYEAHGRPATARLDLSALGPVAAVRATNLLEDDLGPLDPHAVQFRAFELRTVRVERPAGPATPAPAPGTSAAGASPAAS